MSNVVDTKKKSETKKTTISKWTVVLEYDGTMISAGSVEAEKDPKTAFEKALRWFFVFHSKHFPTLKFDDVYGLIKEISEDIVEIELTENDTALNKFSVEIPIKDEDDEVVETKTLTATLFKFSFTQM